jgi:hypothetical protein
MEDEKDLTTATTATETVIEDNVTLSKKEFEQRLNGKFGEGAKKELKRVLDEFGVKSYDELKTKLTDTTELQSIKSRVTQLEAERIALMNGATADEAEDAIALLRGKGKELTESNIKEAVARFRTVQGKAQIGTLPQGTKDKSEIKKIPKVF